MSDWKAWSMRLAQVGPQNFYSQNYFSDYFPGYLYILWIGGLLFNLFSIPINGLYFEFFIKLITTVFDLGSAYYIFKIVHKHNKSWANLAFILYLLNPAVIFNTSVWGQVDGVFTFFLIFSSYLLTQKKEAFKSTFIYSLGVLVKPQSLALFPISFFWVFKNFTTVKLLKSLALGALALILLSIPFFLKNPILGIFDLAITSQNVYKFTSLFAFNFWSIVGWWKSDEMSFIITYKLWGVILYLISTVLIIIPFLKKKVDSSQYYFAASLSFLSFFLFLTRMHERYLFPFLAFILIAAMVKKSKFLLASYITVSILHFVNLWFVYYNYNFNPTHANNMFYFLYVFINNNYKIFSIIMLVLFFSLLVLYYRLYAKKNSN